MYAYMHALSDHPTNSDTIVQHMEHMHKILLGIRIRSEGLAQVMTKRTASEYIIGSIQRYPRTILSSPG